MCRILLVISDKIPLFVKKYIYRFLEQSINPKFTPNIISERDSNYHRDGFGFTWLDKNSWNLYKNHLEYGMIENLDEILNKIKGKLLIGHIRKRCPKSISSISYNNTHPFIYNQHTWCHNGCVDKFNISDFKKLINSKFNVEGETDSEHLFYYFLSILLKKNNTLINNLVETIIEFFTFLKKYPNTVSANIIYSNKNYVMISRFINNKKEPASLYLNKSNKDIILSSEPVLKEFNIFPKNYVWIIDIETKELLIKINLNKL